MVTYHKPTSAWRFEAYTRDEEWVDRVKEWIDQEYDGNESAAIRQAIAAQVGGDPPKSNWRGATAQSATD